MTDLSFPPLFSGRAVAGTTSAFATACNEASRGCDAGLVVHNLGAKHLEAAIVFAPEVTLKDAMAMLPLCGVGFQNALGAIGPPKLAVHLDWQGGILLNGAKAGRLKAAASTQDRDAVPDWLVVGLDLTLWPEEEDPGHTPDQTALYAEGCIDVDPDRLVEAWIRHTLIGITRWLDDGVAALHDEWTNLAHGIGEPVHIGEQSGDFLGVDERFDMLLRDTQTTKLIPLTNVLEHP